MISMVYRTAVAKKIGLTLMSCHFGSMKGRFLPLYQKIDVDICMLTIAVVIMRLYSKHHIEYDLYRNVLFST